MRFQTLVVPLLVAVVTASPVEQLGKRAGGCNANNCYRAVVGFQRTVNPTLCSAYLATSTTEPTALARSCTGTELSSACRCISTTATTTSTSSSIITTTTSSTSTSTTSSSSSTVTSTTSTTSSSSSSTSSSSSSSSTSSGISITSVPPCTTSTAAPTVVLASPTAIAGVVGGNSPENYDDPSFPLTLPFPITFYNVTTSNIFVSINGFISLTADQPGAAYTNQYLPATGQNTATMPDTAIAAFWDDLYVFAGTPQGVFYEVSGVAPGRQLQIEWYTSHFEDSSQFYHFIMTYQEAAPNSIAYSYYDVSDNGISATVGAQSATDGNIASVYSYDVADISPGTVLVFDPLTNTFVPLTTCVTPTSP